MCIRDRYQRRVHGYMDPFLLITDYRDNPICSVCNGRIKGEFVKLGDRTFHNEHFTCCKCAKLLAQNPHKEKDGKLWCNNCFNLTYSPNCKKCGQMITEAEAVEVGGFRYHATCFSCSVCSNNLLPEGKLSLVGDANFFNKDDKLYCQKCHTEAEGLACGGCGKVLEGPYANALGKKWHPECFTCKNCNQRVTGAFANSEGRPVHPECWTG
eukprot:TRINITY_DN18474_c0_g2_i1.p1 TRINITY_DN18474_c0_g2~~TRINITY_DN18474_c0_g2_i1.p1  ORF type:complete len:211 (+),score=25.20 TRINITY_DN18474_c0_g2_i1:65-697(+)